MLLINVFIKKLMEKVKNTNNFTTILGALFLRLTCCDTKTHTRKLIKMFACLHKHNHNIIFNKVGT